MQEDKEAIFDAIDTVRMCLELFSSMLDTITVHDEVMREAASRGFINATDCADYLVRKGLPFRSAYKIVGRLVAYCIDHKKTLETLSMEEYQAVSPVFEEDVYDAIDLETCVAGRRAYGGPTVTSVEHQIDLVNCFIEEQS